MIKLKNFAEELKKFFLANGVILPDSKIEEIAKKNLKEIKEFLLFQKYGRSAVKIAPKQLSSFEEIVKIGGFSGYYDHLEKNEKCRNAILAPIANSGEEELVLYFEAENQVIPGGKDIYEYFKSKGFKVVKKAHPSLLVNAMAKLTEEKLTEMGIPSYVDIVLPTSEDSLLPDESGNLCFLGADRYGGERELRMLSFVGQWGSRYAFIILKFKLLNPFGS